MSTQSPQEVAEYNREERRRRRQASTPDERELAVAERKAWDALARYKFLMFGYWAAIWVHKNRSAGLKQPSPWKRLVLLARGRVQRPRS